MINLFVDTSYKSLFVALVSEEKIIDSIQMIAEANFSEKLVPTINLITKRNNVDLKTINKIFVTVGPGSFTGIRIGLAVCKTLAFSLNKRIVPISSLEFMATTETSSDYKIPFIDARRGYVFAGVYDKNNNIVVEDAYCNLSTLTEKINGSVSYIGYDKLDNIDIVKPDYDCLKIVQKHINDKDYNCHEINPKYLKKTEAEEKFHG